MPLTCSAEEHGASGGSSTTAGKQERKKEGTESLPSEGRVDFGKEEATASSESSGIRKPPLAGFL